MFFPRPSSSHTCSVAKAMTSLRPAAIPASAPGDAQEVAQVHSALERFDGKGAAVMELPHDLSTQGRAYLDWLVIAHSAGLDMSAREAMEATHRNRLLSQVRPGLLSLIEEDQRRLDSMLEANRGTKHAIHELRNWICERTHSAYSIGRALHHFCERIRDDTALSSDDRFGRVLTTLYVVNDIFSSGRVLSILGPYTSLLRNMQSVPEVDLAEAWFNQLLAMFHVASQLAVSDSQREKLYRILKLWEAKKHLNAQRCAALMSVVGQEVVPPQSPEEIMASPYLDWAATPLVLDRTIVSAQSMIPPAPRPPPGRPVMLSAVPPPPPPPPPPPRPMLDQSAANPLRPPLPPNPSQSAAPLTANQSSNRMPMSSGVAPPSAHSNMFQPSLPVHPVIPSHYSNVSFGTAVPEFAVVDLSAISVGKVVNIIKAQLSRRAPKYSLVDLASLGAAVQHAIEPGRLEARLNEFYRKEKDLQPRPRDQKRYRDSSRDRDRNEIDLDEKQYRKQSRR